MISGKQLHGLRVIDQNRNELGVVDDLLADRDSGKILGFIITLPGILANSAYIPATDVLSLDLTGLVIPDKSSIHRIKKNRKEGNTALRMGRFTSSKGYITDIIVQKDHIDAVEITQGLLNDIREGRKIIPWNER